MEKNVKVWQVKWTHITGGYQAPHQLVEVQKGVSEVELMRKASEVASQSRLSSFPQEWKWEVVAEPELPKRGWRKRKKVVSE
jgi:hypothetical protein